MKALRFTSARERRLWLWTATLVLAIFSTVGLARTMAGMLDESGLGAWLFIVACLLILGTVVTRGLTRRPSVAEWALAVGVAAAYLLVFVRMAIPTERSHLVEYGVLALLIHEALLERRLGGGSVRLPALAAIALAAVVGALDEGLQLVVPNRVFDPRDLLFNVLAALMAVVASVALSTVRRRVDS